MKNRVSKGWSKSNAETYGTNPIPETDKMTFRPHLIQVLTVASPTTRVQFTSILSKILRSDYPNDWPEFHDLTLNLLHSNQISEVYSGLIMFLELTKLFRWKSGENRVGLESIVMNIFPVALEIANRLLVDSSLEAGTMLVLILKAYKSVIAVPPCDFGHSNDIARITATTSGRSSFDSVGEFISTSYCERDP